MEVVYKQTNDHEEIKKWVEMHQGKPAIIDDPEITEDKIGLRINWEGKKDEAMLSMVRKETRNISWDEFFAIMEREQLDFMYSDSEGINPTWSYKFLDRYPVEE